MAFGDLIAQLGLGSNQYAATTQAQPTYGNIDPNQLVMSQNQGQQGTDVPLLNPAHPLTQALMQSLSPQGSTPDVSAGVPSADSSTPDNQPGPVVTGHPKSQPIIPGSQTPTGGVIPDPGSQPGVAVAGYNPHPNALMGLIHGAPARFLNNFLDGFYSARGLAPPNYTRTLQAQEANALQGFTQHNMEAVQRLAQVDPQGAQEMYMKLLEAARVGQAASDAHATSQNNLENNVLGAAGRIIRNSTPDNYASHYALAQQLADKNGFKLDPLGVPDPAEIAAGKHVVKDSQGNTIWDDDTDKSLETAANYGTPTYRVQNTQASQQQAQARMMQAETGRMVAPSTIAFHNALAKAATSNAGTRARMVDLDTQYRQGVLDEQDYANGLKSLIVEANNPQIAGKIPATPRGGGQRPSTPKQAPQSNSSDPVVSVGHSKTTGQVFYRHRSGAITTAP